MCRERLSEGERRSERVSRVVNAIVQGFACLYGDKYRHYYWRNDRYESFDAGCFSGSIWGTWLARDHNLAERAIAKQEDSTLELLDTPVGLAFRAKILQSAIEWIGDRREVSVSYYPTDTENRNGVFVIKKATLLELSLCSVATIRQTHAIICDPASCGTLEEDVKSGRFNCDGAHTKMMDALRRLQN